MLEREEKPYKAMMKVRPNPKHTFTSRAISFFTLTKK